MEKVLYLTLDRHPENLKILIREKLAEFNFELIECNYSEIRNLEFEDLSEISGVLLAPARFLPVNILSRLSNCKLVQIWSSGYDKFNLSDAKSQKLLVANNGGSNAQSVAEHTLALILSVSRKIKSMSEYVENHDWTGNDHGLSANSLYGKTLGIIGFGKIGMKVAAMAQSFGMKVIYHDSVDRKIPMCHHFSLENLLQSSDYISLHLHLNEETRGIINDANIHNIVKRPYLINVSRAELIDREALKRLVSENKIKGLGIDVYYDEPNDAKDDWMFDIPSVGTPHIAGSTLETYVSAVNFCAQNLRNAIDGLEPESLI
jgi:phosphoglycerate dehydrogenase-like enzyme